MSSLRHEKGRSYSISGGMHAFADGGYMDISVEVPNKKVGRTVAEILDHIEQTRTKPIPQQDIEIAKAAYLAKLLPWGNEALAWKFAEYESEGLSPADLSKVVEQVRNLKPDQLQAAARTHLFADKVSILTLGDFNDYDSFFYGLGSVRKLAPRARSKSKN